MTRAPARPHRLQDDLRDALPRADAARATSSTAVRNFNVAVREVGDEILFLHRLQPGGADRSYGIEVGRLAGLPQPVIDARAAGPRAARGRAARRRRARRRRRNAARRADRISSASSPRRRIPLVERLAALDVEHDDAARRRCRCWPSSSRDAKRVERSGSYMSRPCADVAVSWLPLSRLAASRRSALLVAARDDAAAASTTISRSKLTKRFETGPQRPDEAAADAQHRASVPLSRRRSTRGRCRATSRCGCSSIATAACRPDSTRRSRSRAAIAALDSAAVRGSQRAALRAGEAARRADGGHDPVSRLLPPSRKRTPLPGRHDPEDANSSRTIARCRFQL